MGIQVEFNPDLALRDIKEFQEGRRAKEECIPEKLEVDNTYHFLKKGQRNYYMNDDEYVPLVETQGNQQISRPLAGVRILEATHFLKNGEIWTKGKYRVAKILDKNSEVIFNGFQLVPKN